MALNMVRSFKSEPLEIEHLPRDRQTPGRLSSTEGFLPRRHTSFGAAVLQPLARCRAELPCACKARGCTRVPYQYPCYNSTSMELDPRSRMVQTFPLLHHVPRDVIARMLPSPVWQRTSNIQTQDPSCVSIASYAIPVKVTGHGFNKLSNIGVFNPLGLH